MLNQALNSDDASDQIKALRLKNAEWLTEELGATMHLNGQDVRIEALSLLAADLAHLPTDLLKMALARIRAEHRGQILAGTVMQYVDHAMGRLLPAEAYALALTSTDDRLTVVWTNEIAESWAIAAPLMNAGDKFGARQAFIEAYARITGEARALRRAPQVQVSLGHETEGRVRAIQEALTAGRLPYGLDSLSDDVREQLQLPAPRSALALAAPEKSASEEQQKTMRKLERLRNDFAGRAARRFTRAQVLARAEKMRLSHEKRSIAERVASYMRGSK